MPFDTAPTAEEVLDLPTGTKDANGNFLEPEVRIFRGTEIQGDCLIGAYSEINGATIYPFSRIGRYCSIARNAAIGATNHPIHCLGTSLQLSGTKAAREIPETRVGHDVWIGANAVVVGGITVGNGALIGAGAVVTHDVEPYAIVLGVPGRTVRHRFPEPIRTELLALKWWDLDREAVECLPHADVEKCLRILRLLRSAPDEKMMPKRATT